MMVDDNAKVGSEMKEPLLAINQEADLGINENEEHEPLIELEETTMNVDGDDDDELLRVDGMPLTTSILLKSLYFLEALGNSAWGRFGTIYYNLHGLNSQQIGLMEGLMPVVRTFSQPLWGFLADQYHCRKFVYLFTKSIGTCVLLLLALPYVYKRYSRIMFVSLTTMAFAGGGILDSYTLDMLGTKNKIKYGRYRLWASLSWGIGAIVMGYITDNYGFEFNFILYALLGALCMSLISWRIPNVDKQKSATDSGRFIDLLRLIVRPRVLFFILEIIIIGAGMGTVERLLFLYLVNDLKSSTLLCGLSVGVNVLFELPIFWYAQNFMAKLGHDGMIITSLVCFVVRVYGYTLLTPSSAYAVLPLEAMHGITFACFWVVTTDVAKVLIHEVNGWNTTIPTAVNTLCGAVGAGLGSVVGGWAMHHWGSKEMYKCTATILFLTLILHTLGAMFCRFFFKTSLLPDYKPSDMIGEESEIEDEEVRQQECEEDQTRESTSDTVARNVV